MENELGIEVLEPVREDGLGVERLRPSKKKKLSVKEKLEIKKVEGLSEEEKATLKSYVLKIWYAVGFIAGLFAIGLKFLWDTTVDLMSWEKRLEKKDNGGRKDIT